jgi:hypothetical protein
LEGRVVQLGVVCPPPLELCDARFTLHAEVRAHLHGRRMVQVAPALLPDDRSERPAPVRPGQQDLQRFGEAALATAVAADDKRQPRPRRELQSLAWPDSTEAFDGDGAEVGTGRFVGLSCGLACLGLRGSALALAAGDLVEALWAFARSENEHRPGRVFGAAIGQALLNESKKLSVHAL